MPFALQKLRDFALAAARAAARAASSATPAGQRRLDRLPGPAGTVRDAQLRRRRGRAVRPGGRAREDRRGRRDRRARRRTSHQTSTSGNRFMSGPEIQAAAIATALRGFPLARRRRLARRAARARSLGASSRRWSRCASARSSALVAGLLAVVAFLIAAQLAFDARHDPRRSSRRSPAALVGLRRARVAVANPQRSPALNRVLDRLTRDAGQPAHAPAARAAAARRRAVGRRGHARRSTRASVLRNGWSSRPSTSASTSAATQPPPHGHRARRHRRQDVRQPPQPRCPFDRARLTPKVIRNLTKAGAKVIAYDVQFSEHERRPTKGDERPRRGGARRRATSCWPRPRPTSSGETNVFSFGKGLAYSGGDRRRSRTIRKDADGRIRQHGLRASRSSSSVPDGRGARPSVGQRDRDARRRRRLDRLRRAARDRSRTSASSTSARQPFNPARRARQGRRGRRDRDRRCRTCTTRRRRATG